VDRRFWKTWGKIVPLALSWLLGNDSSVMMGRARQDFSASARFPAVRVDIGKNFAEMYNFRVLFAAEWGRGLLLSDYVSKAICRESQRDFT